MSDATTPVVLEGQEGPGLAMAVLGGDEFTLGFELVGIKTVIRTDGLGPDKRLDAIMRAMRDPAIGILIVDAQALSGIGAYERAQLENAIRPVVVVLHATSGETGDLRRQIMRAIGVDLYAHDDEQNGTHE